MRLAAVCAVYGGYDLIPPVPEGVDDAVLVSDVPVRSGWRNVVEPSTTDPRLAAKRPKARPDLFTDCEASLWIDGSIHVRGTGLAERSRELLQVNPLVLTDHPEDRTCLYAEAEHCRTWAKHAGEPLEEQVAHYRSIGMPEGFGLWAAGCMARVHTPAMQRFGDAWLAEIGRWSIRDQVSLPFVLWRDQISFTTFGIDQLDNAFYDVLPHAQEIRDHRRTVLALESRIIHLEGEIGWLRKDVSDLGSELVRLRARRSVRVALRMASIFRPAIRILRRGRTSAG